ncbi:MAG: enoyl-CoA hydratase/isomerase family protein [Alphaproteobacteria bacterium]|nr:enoyl-CoA hydratase/isomerase family protein [Alphaproteobacteria bacterium]
MGGDYHDIRFERAEPAIALITLARPKQMNAYTTRLCEEVVRALEIYLRDDGLRVLILTGEGRGFCAGGDVSGAPVIAMINGPAVAGGLALALSCDFRIASDTAKLGDTSGRFGLLPDEGGAWLFPRTMGLDRALKMTMLAETYDAKTAQELGLVTEVVPAAELEARTMAFARKLAARAPLAVRLAKAMMVRGLTQTLDQSLGEAALSVMVSNPSQDVREGVKAFFEKREPIFEGR